MEKFKFDKFVGSWVQTIPWDSDDYLTEYQIGGDFQKPIIS